MNAWLDTLLNLSAFVFIGILIWLYFKPDPPADDSRTEL